MVNTDGTIQRLLELGIAMPTPPRPLGAYKPVIQTACMTYISMQGPNIDGKPIHTGLLGRDLTIESGQAPARICVINALAQLNAHLGGLDRISQIVALDGSVACTEDFTNHSQVLDAASELLVDIFKDRAGQVRSVCGVRNLPGNVPVALALSVELMST
ncbi:RidA family protein [Brucella tritici]|uniref:RidA family protein n=1 Tax=Brucella tritici TaxID=94626 RepID=UPI003D6D1812